MSVRSLSPHRAGDDARFRPGAVVSAGAGTASQRSPFTVFDAAAADHGGSVSVSVPDRVPIHSSHPRQSTQQTQSVQHLQSFNHLFRQHRETTQHPRQRLQPVPVRPVAHPVLIPSQLQLNPSRNIPARPPHSGAFAHSRFQLHPPPQTPDIDITNTSLSSASEAEDQERIQRYLSSRRPLFSTQRNSGRTPSIDDFIEDLTGQRLEVTAQRRWRPTVAQQHTRFASDQKDILDEMAMLRRRMATGGEALVSPEKGEIYDSPPAEDFGNTEGFREFQSRGPAEAMRERKYGKRKGIVPPKLSNFSNLYSTKTPNTTPNKETHDDMVWPDTPSTDGRRSADDSRRTLSSGTKPVAHRSSSLSLKLKDGEAPFQSVQKRAEERSTAVRSPSMTMKPGGRPTSAASIERQRAIASPTEGPSLSTNKPSRVSPATSRPNSSQEQHRRTFSTISSTAERRPLRSTPSTNSLASRASDTASPLPPRGTHGRSDSSPNPTSHIDKRTVKRQSVPAGHPSTIKRSESAATDYSETGSVISSTSTGPLSIRNGPASSNGSEKASPSKASSGKTETRPGRADSIDSFMGPTGNGNAGPNTRPSPTKAMKSAAERIKSRESVLRSPTQSDYDDFMEEARGNASPTPYGSTSPLYDRSTGKIKPFPKPPKSALEDMNDEMGDLEELKRKDQEYEALLNPPKQEDDDDTFMLLGGTKKYEPRPGQIVRPKAEAIAGDRDREHNKSVHDKMMNRLKTLHMELRSARRGIDYLERRLNGVGSSDESEWVDDEEFMRGMTEEAVVKRIKSEESLQRQKLTNDIEKVAQVQTQAQAQAQAQEPAIVSSAPSSKILKYGTVGFQIAMLWFLLEIYFLYVILQSPHLEKAKLLTMTQLQILPSFYLNLSRLRYRHPHLRLSPHLLTSRKLALPLQVNLR